MQIEEIFSFAHRIIDNKILQAIDYISVSPNDITISLTDELIIEKIYSNYTQDGGIRFGRSWECIEYPVTEKVMSLPLPAKSSAFFINLEDEKKLIYSSEYHERNV